MAARKTGKSSDPAASADASIDETPTQEGIDAAPPAIVDTPDPAKPQSPRSNLGILSLEVPSGWRFFPMEDSVVGRPDTNVGVLVIKKLPADIVPENATHEMFMSAARAACGYELEGTGTDPARERIGCCYAGGESFRMERDFVRVWYHHRPEGLVVAWFAAKAKRMAERSVRPLVGQCDKIIASVRLPSQSDA